MKKVCIICSLSQKEKVLQLVDLLEKDFHLNVYHPFLNQDGSLISIQEQYLAAIEDCDLVIAIPKNFALLKEIKGTTIMQESFGESVSYEMAYALRIGTPIIYLGAMNYDML